MKKLCCLLLLLQALLHTPLTFAQPVPRTTVVEHFTNTFCSVCASRNPGFYSNLAAFPQVLHIAYYPSAPYAACPFNQMNKPENDARTKFYGVYGATPRLVVNGAPVDAGTLYTDPAIFQNGLSQAADFSMNVQVRRLSATMAEATITVKKVAANALDHLTLYAVVAEDTVQFNANNGETVHYDKFNKSLTGNLPLALTGLSSVGDSVREIFSFATGTNWSPSRITAMLQDDRKNGLQAARSARISPVINMPVNQPLVCPNPAGRLLYLPALPTGYHNYSIHDMTGRLVQRGVAYDPAVPLSLSSMGSGVYMITIGEGAAMQRTTFVKQ